MELEPGATLGRYRLESVIGRGGMGVVWRATDTTLGRAVALKFLPAEVARDAERVARFDREARVLAALNHPGIAAVYGFESAGDARFLVLELAEGETLASRMARGPIPVAETLSLGLQIAAALEAAHERGIVHRDLKPQNVQVDREGAVKLLDFGLARAFTADGASGVTRTDDSPTISALMTSPEIILGTAAYMSPEQARGRPVDRRADIWAFGVVLFEALTGRQLFAGETVSDTIASVLRHEIPWSELPPDLPASVRALLGRCLERDPRQRLRDIGEARIALERAAREPADVAAAPAETGDAATSRGPRGLARAGLLGLALAVGALASWLALRGSTPSATVEAPPRRFRLASPPGPVTHLAPVLSPDGRMAAYATAEGIWIHALDQLEPRSLVQEAGVTRLFWSPDSRWIGYLAGSRMGKVAATGGTPQTLVRISSVFATGSSAAWGENGRIVATNAGAEGLFEVPEGGGDPRTILLPDTTRDSDFHDPSLLPGGRGLLVVVHRNQGSFDNLTLLEGNRRSVVLELPGESIAGPVWSPTGHIVFERLSAPGGLWALPFSLDRRKATGEPIQLVEQGTHPSIASDGTMLYLERQTSDLQLAWVDRQGELVDTLGPPSGGHFGTFDLSPDGNRVVLPLTSPTGTDLWIYDVRRGTRSRLAADAGTEQFPAWSPGGTFIAYQSAPRIPPASALEWVALLRRSDGSGRADTLAVAGAVAPVVLPGERQFVCAMVPGQGGSRLRLASLEGDAAPVPIVESAGTVSYARPSPDGRWLAYLEAGLDFSGSEVWVCRLPGGENRVQVSSGGGLWPRWSERGDRLWFVQGDDVMEVEVGPGDPLEFGRPTRLFSRAPTYTGMPFGWTPWFDVRGDRFLILRPARRPGSESLVLWQNWSPRGRERR
jgi:Tol biopolymer transport system component